CFRFLNHPNMTRALCRRTTSIGCRAGSQRQLTHAKPGCRPGQLHWLDTTHGLRSGGPHLSPSITRSRVAPVAAWIFQVLLKHTNHEAGSGRPSPRRSRAMPNYNRQHAYYAGVDLHARTLFLHICDPAGQALDSPAHRPDRAVTVRGSSALIEWTHRRNGEVSGALGDAWPSAFLNGKPA